MEQKVSFTKKTADREYLAEPPQPDPQDPIPNLRECRAVKGVRYFPPAVPEIDERIDILFVQVAPTPEEASIVTETPHGLEIPRKASLGTGAASQIVKETANRFSTLSSHRIAFASLIPWLLPKSRRFRPNKDEIEKCAKHLRGVVAKVRPRVVVAMGSHAFKALCPINISHDDARYGWFDTGGEHPVPLYLSIPWHTLVSQPWSQGSLLTDLQEVDRFLRLKDDSITLLPVNTVEIRTIPQLIQLVDKWKRERLMKFSVDCEWGRGSNHIDGDLRSIQFCWNDTDTAHLNFYDETGARHLGARDGGAGTDYRKIGAILNMHLADPDVRFIGHHFTADSPWMSEVLGIAVLGRCEFDSEYALQAVDEYSPRGLEVLALRFTDFGRYDADLIEWKRANPKGIADGYDKIPDSILIPYGARDVLTVWRSRPYLERRMQQDDVLNYYQSILNPFVTDTFHDFVTEGLPISLELFEAVRVFMNWAYRVLMEDFLKAVSEQADELLAARLAIPVSLLKAVAAAAVPQGAEAAARAFNNVNKSGDPVTAEDPLVLHRLEIQSFNIRSSPCMRRWLFDVMGLTPVKTTKGGTDGPPSMLWEKALEMPPHILKTLKPATDKETLEILEPKDESGLISRVLAVSNVGNQCKGFLKEGDYDSATGELVKENGLAKFIASDNRIHGQFSLTETGRPRSWQPNILNLSAFHNKGVEAGLVRVLSERSDLEIPPECAPLLGTREMIEAEVVRFAGENPEKTAAECRTAVMKDLVKKNVPTVRSTIHAIPGYCFVESDYKTAEIRALAFIFGDRALIKLMTEPDPSFALNKEGDPIRLYYEDDCGIPPENRNPEWEMKLVEEGVVKQTLTDADLMRDEDGNIVHPPYDLHWTLCELVYGKPREELSAKKDRGAAKVANFSCCPDGLILLKRGVEQLINLGVDDLVWDGTEFVRHEGIIYQGIRLTIEYGGVRATPEHIVYPEDGEGECLLRTALRDTVDSLVVPLVDTSSGDLGRASQHPGAGLQRLRSPLHPPRRDDPAVTLPQHGPALREGDACQCDQLQVSGDQGSDRVGTGVRGVGNPELAGGGLQGEGLRPDQQRRGLHAGQPPARVTVGEPEEHQDLPEGHKPQSGPVSGSASGHRAGAENDLEQDPERGATGGHPSIREHGDDETPCSGAGGVQNDPSSSTAGSQPDPGNLPEAGLQALPQGSDGRGDPVPASEESRPDHPGGSGGDCEADRRGLRGEDDAQPPVPRPYRAGDPGPMEFHGREAGEVFAKTDVIPVDSGIGRHRKEIPTGREIAAALRSFRERSGGFADFVDTYLECAQFPADLDIARLEAAGLNPRLEPVFDISDCGPRRRFAVLVPDTGVVVGSPHERRDAQGFQAEDRDQARDEGRQVEALASEVPSGGARRGSSLQHEEPPSVPGRGSDDCGPPQAFRQVIVSNCAYGAVASTIERRIEAVTGIKPDEGTGEALLAALLSRQPDVFRGLDEVAEAPGRGDVLRAASGRVRRFPVHSSSLSGVSWRVRKSYLRAMGNEARNFYPQESVAATLARACRWLNNWYRAEGMKAKAVIGLYDSVLTHCPLEERHLAAEAHEVFMHRINFWKYGKRYMNYPIDTDLVYRWSYKPSKEEKKTLEDTRWNAMDPERQSDIMSRLHARENAIFAAQPWVVEVLNKV